MELWNFGTLELWNSGTLVLFDYKSPVYLSLKKNEESKNQ